ncbi:hypothetical protein G6F57_019777 [Rhizopus arrhizus]|nr:hypothetical protein G6F57_019777 [Rhizopus arrhizus]
MRESKNPNFRSPFRQAENRAEGDIYAENRGKSLRCARRGWRTEANRHAEEHEADQRHEDPRRRQVGQVLADEAGGEWKERSDQVAHTLHARGQPACFRGRCRMIHGDDQRQGKERADAQPRQHGRRPSQGGGRRDQADQTQEQRADRHEQRRPAVRQAADA